MRKAAPGVCGSSAIVAMPPNSQSSMPMMRIRLRMATSACPSSCRITQKNSSSALTVASTNDLLSCPGKAPLYWSERDQMMRNRTMNQLGFTPMRIPKIRAS